jgi:hypothetical protein
MGALVLRKQSETYRKERETHRCGEDIQLLRPTAMMLTPKFSSRIADRSVFGFSIQPQENMMKAAQYFKAGVIGIALLGAGSALAEDLALPADPVQQREKMRSMSPEDRTAYRDQMQERMRSMTPEEQRLMRETRADGRDRMANQQAEGTRQRSRDGSGQGGYGQGYESRRGDGSGSGGGGGRGMGGGGGGGGRGR